MKCQGTTVRNHPCGNNAEAGSRFCFLHQNQKNKSNKKGGPIIVTNPNRLPFFTEEEEEEKNEKPRGFDQKVIQRKIDAYLHGVLVRGQEIDKDVCKSDKNKFHMVEFKNEYFLGLHFSDDMIGFVDQMYLYILIALHRIQDAKHPHTGLLPFPYIRKRCSNDDVLWLFSPPIRKEPQELRKWLSDPHPVDINAAGACVLIQLADACAQLEHNDKDGIVLNLRWIQIEPSPQMIELEGAKQIHLSASARCILVHIERTVKSTTFKEVCDQLWDWIGKSLEFRKPIEQTGKDWLRNYTRTNTSDAIIWKEWPKKIKEEYDSA